MRRACVLGALALLLAGCQRASLFGRFFGGSFATLVRAERTLPHRIREPRRPEARLAALWVGHATVLLQLDDKFVLTDPVFTDSVGQLSKRYVEPGLAVEDVPPLAAVVISHLHFDHLSLGSLELLRDKTRRLYLPEGGAVYVPRGGTPPIELPVWQAFEEDGLRVTAVPVQHLGWRYAGDRAWMTTSYTGYVIEYHGLRVYFGGDTAATPAFARTGAHFPNIDLALLPIAPIHPRDFMCRVHMDPAQALDAFHDLGARLLMPIHYDTFMNSLDAFGEAPAALRRLARERGLEAARVAILAHGEQRVFVQR